MSYKPKFCCQCGDPIKRVGWTLLTSRRFCELCETDYQLDEWIPRIGIAAAVLFGIFGLGTFLQKAEKPLNLASGNSIGNSTNVNKSAVNNQVPSNANIQTFAKSQETNSAAAQSPAKPPNAPSKQDLKTQRVVNQPNAEQEVTYFCGAETKKGKPCTRRVKGGGRCWQHAGKPALLSPEKLVASQ